MSDAPGQGPSRESAVEPAAVDIEVGQVWQDLDAEYDWIVREVGDDGFVTLTTTVERRIVTVDIPRMYQLAAATDWRCECGDLNRVHEAFCYRCGAGQPESEADDMPEPGA